MTPSAKSRLDALADRVHSLEQAQRRRKRKLDAKHEHERELLALVQRLGKESRDVERIQGIAGWLFHLTGSHAERLDREQRERALAELRVESKRALLVELDAELAACPEPGRELRELRKEYDAALERRRQKLQADAQHAQKLHVIEAEILQAKAQVERFTQLHEQMRRALEAFRQGHAELVKATRVAGLDTLVGGGVIDIAAMHGKYQLVEAAHRQLRLGELLLAEAAAELRELEEFPDLKPEIGTWLRITDIVFDWFSSDYEVLTRIEDSAEALATAIASLEGTQGWVEKRLRQAHQHQENLELRREGLLRE